ncbi:MAG: geranylgeranylglyceryl/heptaprenylglyceryl phosphate synthase [Bacteroidota bacterium]|nr:geranylgeranylglyceryl/heptaprenylglyceryl phosphate synthase [Bacteroidota bacterium]
MKFDKLIHKKKSSLAVLVDPDKFDKGLIKLLNKSSVKFILVGGSKLKRNNLKEIVKAIKKITKIPVVLFPGDESQLCKEADGIFILSLLSGRNPEYLIEKQIRAAQKIKELKLKTFPVAYILVDTGSKSQTQKISKTKPLKDDKKILDTMLAAEQLGFKAVYLEAGSGSKQQINSALINKASQTISIPLIVGGGISSALGAKKAKSSGANVVVVGNALEKNKHLIHALSKVFV